MPAGSFCPFCSVLKICTFAREFVHLLCCAFIYCSFQIFKSFCVVMVLENDFSYAWLVVMISDTMIFDVTNFNLTILTFNCSRSDLLPDRSLGLSRRNYSPGSGFGNGSLVDDFQQPSSQTWM